MSASLIRHGTIARLRGRLVPGRATAFGPDALDTLDFEFEALTGRYRGSRFWEFMPVNTERGRFAYKNTLRGLRQMLDSALGLDPRDESRKTRPKRVLPNIAAFDRIEFVGRIAVEHLGPVRMNRLAAVITPDDPQWRKFMRGTALAERLPMRGRQ